MIQIPHVACIVDSPNHFVSLARSSYSIISCSDQLGCDFFKGLNHDNVVFMPHGVDTSLISPIENIRSRDVIALASFIDDEHIRSSWHQKFAPAVCAALEEAAEDVLSNPNTSYIQAFVDAFNHHGAENPKDVDFIEVLDELVMYVKGKDRIHLIKSITDAKVDIFGSTAEGTRSWQDCLGSHHPNITCHEPISYQQALEEMKKSRIVLNSYPWVRYGAHERLFASYACGALPITTENEFLKQTFIEGQDIAFYRYGKLDKVNDLVNGYLEDEEKRLLVTKNGQQVVLDHHTWDHRARALLQDLGPILEKIKATS